LIVASWFETGGAAAVAGYGGLLTVRFET